MISNGFAKMKSKVFLEWTNEYRILFNLSHIIKIEKNSWKSTHFKNVELTSIRFPAFSSLLLSKFDETKYFIWISSNSLPNPPSPFGKSDVSISETMKISWVDKYSVTLLHITNFKRITRTHKTVWANELRVQMYLNRFFFYNFTTPTMYHCSMNRKWIFQLQQISIQMKDTLHINWSWYNLSFNFITYSARELQYMQQLFFSRDYNELHMVEHNWRNA